MESSIARRAYDPSLEPHRGYMKAHLMFRSLAFLITLAAALIMGLNKENSDIIAGYEMKASYKISPAFKLLVAGNAVASAYSLISLFFVADLVEGYLFHLLDLLIMGLSMASASAATAIAYVGKRGNDEMGWSMVCPYFDKFCYKCAVSIALTYVGFVLFLLVCALSSVYKTRLIADA